MCLLGVKVFLGCLWTTQPTFPAITRVPLPRAFQGRNSAFARAGREGPQVTGELLFGNILMFTLAQAGLGARKQPTTEGPRSCNHVLSGTQCHATFPSICHLPLIPAEMDPIQEVVHQMTEHYCETGECFHNLRHRNRDQRHYGVREVDPDPKGLWGFNIAVLVSLTKEPTPGMFRTIFFLKRFLHICVFCLLYVCSPNACSTHRGQERVLGPQEMELETVAIGHMGAGNQTLGRSSTRTASALNHWATSLGSAPWFLSFWG